MKGIASSLEFFEDFRYNHERLTVFSQILFSIPMFILTLIIFVLVMIILCFMWIDITFRIISGVGPHKVIDHGREDQ